MSAHAEPPQPEGAHAHAAPDAHAADAPDPRVAPQAGAMSYEAASARVEEIIRSLDSGQTSLDETLRLLSARERR